MGPWDQLRNAICSEVPIFKLNHLSNHLHGALLVINVPSLLGGNSRRAYKTLLEALKIPSHFIICHSANVNVSFCIPTEA